MLRNRPYEERIVRLNLERAAFFHATCLFFSLKAFVPSLEVLEAESLHIKLFDPLFADDFEPVVGGDCRVAVADIAVRSF